MKLTGDQITEFREQGLLVAEAIITEEDLAPVIAAYEKFIDERARQLLSEGKISNMHEGERFERRFACIYEESDEINHGLDIMEAKLPEMFEFLRNDNLLDAVECLVGPEITCSPIQHIRAKPPARSDDDKGAGFFNVPWHQDAGVTWEEADNSEIVTCWLPLVDATVENGCMEVLPGVWKQGFREHQKEGGTSIRPDLMPEVQPSPVPVRKGGAVFMHRHTPHRSTPNNSDVVRWSLDLRFQKTGTPTGRPFHPDFVVRSRENPSTVLTDHAAWCKMWEEALENSKGIRAHRVK